MRRRGPRAAPRKKRSAGVSLVELLVAVLVTGVGVLGAAGLMALSLQGNRAALLGTEAALLVADMMERIRVNAAGGGAARLYDGLALGDPPPPPPDCGAVECTAEQIATYDQATWKCRLGRFAQSPLCIGLAEAAGLGIRGATPEGAGLREGDGAIDVDPATRRVRIRVQWRDRGQLHALAVQSRI